MEPCSHTPQPSPFEVYFIYFPRHKVLDRFLPQFAQHLMCSETLSPFLIAQCSDVLFLLYLLLEVVLSYFVPNCIGPHSDRYLTSRTYSISLLTHMSSLLKPNHM